MIFSSKLLSRIIVLGVAAVLISASGSSAAAQTNLREQLEDIKQQVNTLQQDILNNSNRSNSSESTTTTTTSLSIANLDSIPSFKTNLSYGDRSPEVRHLQQLLNQALPDPVAETGPGSLGQETAFFGSKTAAAVRRFQSQYASQILSPVGLENPTGYVGPSTRGKLNDILEDVEEFSANNQGNIQNGDLNETTDNFSGDSELDQLRSQFSLTKWSFTEEEKRQIAQTVPSELRSKYFPEYAEGGGTDNEDSEGSLQQDYKERLEQQTSAMERLKNWVSIEALKQPTQLLQHSLAAIFGQPDTAQAQINLVFGGRISLVVPCTCNPPAVQVTIVGPRPASVVYFPFASQKAPPTPPAPGASTLGNYSPFGVCLMGVPPACPPSAAFGSIIQMGTSY